MNSRYTIINFIVIAICFLTSLSAQSESVMLSDSLSLDNTIRYGRLPNGFTYYIKTLTEPQSKLYLKFIVKAGSNQ